MKATRRDPERDRQKPEFDLAAVPDVVAAGLCILFVGFNPGIRSSETGHHFAGPSNRFWKLLHSSGLTPRQYSPEEDSHLLSLGYGITNIVSRPTRSAAEITKTEYRAGGRRLVGLITSLRPVITCYEGIGVYKEFSGQKRVQCGRQQIAVAGDTIDFVVPSPSGLNRMTFHEQLRWHEELKRLKDSLC